MLRFLKVLGIHAGILVGLVIIYYLSGQNFGLTFTVLLVGVGVGAIGHHVFSSFGKIYKRLRKFF